MNTTSDDFTEIDDESWENVALRKIFLECYASSSSNSSLLSLPSTTSRINVANLVDYIRDNVTGFDRDKALVDELEKAIEKVSSNGQINWMGLKKATKDWVAKVLRSDQFQDGNNNIQSDQHSKCAMSDTTPESADETDFGYGGREVPQVDLRLRVRRFDEENALLREELTRAEELATGLERQCENLYRKFEQKNEQFRLLQQENDEHKEILDEITSQKQFCQTALLKAEKERSILARKLEDAETEKERIIEKLEKCIKEKTERMKEANLFRQKSEEQQAECEVLKEKLAQLEEANDHLQESYEKTIRHLREKNEELKIQNFDLHMKYSGESPSDEAVSTPPVSLQSHMQSTPYSNRDVKLQDSLYTELKASGFSPEDASTYPRIRELEDELSLYNEEIRDAVKHVEKILEQIARELKIPHVPDLKLEESARGDEKTVDICTLLQKLSQLSNTVNEITWKSKVKDASVQVCGESMQMDQRQYNFLGIPSFEDCLRLSSEHRDRGTREDRKSDVFVEAISMNSNLLGEYVDEVEVATEAESYREIEAILPSYKKSMSALPGIQEHTIIEPIVEELDRIIKFTNKTDEELSTKNTKYRCIYTCTHPASDVCPLSQKSPIEKPSKPDLASTYIISSGGDGPSYKLINHSSINEDSTQNSSSFPISFVSESLQKLNDSVNTTNQESKVTADEFTNSEIQDTRNDTGTFTPPPPAIPPTLPPIPKKNNEQPITENVQLHNGISSTYCVTPNSSLRCFPKRKISVFRRSFDIDTLPGDESLGNGSGTYRLREHSLETSDNFEEKTKVDQDAAGNDDDDDDDDDDDRMELDLECMKMNTSYPLNFAMNTYRTNDNDSDSSDSPSPVRPVPIPQDDSMSELPVRKNQRPPIIAPTRLKLPSPKASDTLVTPVVTVDKCNEDFIVHEIVRNESMTKRKLTNDLTKVISPSIEVIRPGDEIDMGITYRRPYKNDSNFTSFSLLETINATMEKEKENASTIIEHSDDESTSCDSSPKREPPVIKPTHLNLSLGSTYEKSTSPDCAYIRQVFPSDRLTAEAIVGYKTRDSGGGGNGSGIRGPSEKSSVSPAVALAMSSGEDSSDSECDPMAIQGDEDRLKVDETDSLSLVVLPFADGAVLVSSTPAEPASLPNNALPDECGDIGLRKPMAQNRDKRERLQTKVRRSLSESGCGRFESCCCTEATHMHAKSNKEETQTNVFPSLTDARLQECGIANLSITNELQGNLSENDLERKYTALSVGLVTDRVTLPKRLALSIRQRDQSERNLAYEVQKMQQDIQDLAPLCIDRESVERVERVRLQLEMISQCAHRVSCTAETLGAVHQENRISRAILLADRYLLVLRSRCEKLAADVAETKRILTENNIVVEENNGELGDDMPRIRYRGMPTNNRTMMARRRASIATIFRPMSNFQDVTKDGVRQRNSVSGRVTLRRPSLSAESQKWEADKLDRTDSSSSSIGELREIFEQAESRRNSREENNNILRLHSSNLNVRESENVDGDLWTNTREEPIAELLAITDGCQESRPVPRSPLSLSADNHGTWKPFMWCIIISFFFGFYIKHILSTGNGCAGSPFRWYTMEDILERYIDVKNNGPRPT